MMYAMNETTESNTDF